MEVILLGTSAGGGYPQWNCWCPPCRAARTHDEQGRVRTQSSAAVSADGERWFLLNASPDVRAQLGRLPAAAPAGVRAVPIEGILTTDAELDHTLGLVLLREAGALRLYVTHAVRAVLEHDSRILPVTGAFSQVMVTDLLLDGPIELRCRDGEPSGLTVEALPVPGDPPRFARDGMPGHTVGLMLRDRVTGGSCAYVPSCGALDACLLRRFGQADLLIFDGTFWADEELIALGIDHRTARQLYHLPISGPQGSLKQLRALPCCWRVFSHINNTNPILLEHSAERATVERAGLTVGTDGLRFTL